MSDYGVHRDGKRDHGDVTTAGYKEDPPTDIQTQNRKNNPLNGKRVGLLQALITVVDIHNQDKNGKYRCYNGALIDILPWRHNGHVQDVHGMIEVGHHVPEEGFQEGGYLTEDYRFQQYSEVLMLSQLVWRIAKGVQRLIYQ